MFEGPVLHAMIFTFQNNEDLDYEVKVNISDSLYGESTFIPSSFFKDKQQCVFSIREYKYENFYAKLRKDCVNLQSVIDIRQAIKTGNDKVYLSDIAFEDNYKPILRGKDIQRYYYRDPHIYVDYGSHLACPRSAAIFEQPKILIREAGAKITATYDDNNYYIMSSLYNAILIDKDFDLKYILALLNSKLYQFLMNKITFEKTKGAFTKAKIFHYYQLPVKKMDKQYVFVNLVNRIIDAYKTNNHEILSLENHIDICVFKLYELTYDEVRMIDENIQISEEDYNQFKL